MVQQFQARIEGLSRPATFGPGDACAWTDGNGVAHTGTIGDSLTQMASQTRGPRTRLTITILAGQYGGNPSDCDISGPPGSLRYPLLGLLGLPVPGATGQQGNAAAATAPVATG